MLLKGAYCEGEHFVALQCFTYEGLNGEGGLVFTIH